MALSEKRKLMRRARRAESRANMLKSFISSKEKAIQDTTEIYNSVVKMSKATKEELGTRILEREEAMARAENNWIVRTALKVTGLYPLL